MEQKWYFVLSTVHEAVKHKNWEAHGPFQVWCIRIKHVWTAINKNSALLMDLRLSSKLTHYFMVQKVLTSYRIFQKLHKYGKIQCMKYQQVLRVRLKNYYKSYSADWRFTTVRSAMKYLFLDNQWLPLDSGSSLLIGCRKTIQTWVCAVVQISMPMWTRQWIQTWHLVNYLRYSNSHPDAQQLIHVNIICSHIFIQESTQTDTFGTTGNQSQDTGIQNMEMVQSSYL